jgi:hypothetical protein
MPMKSLKLNPNDLMADMPVSVGSMMQRDEFPYGVRIHLTGDELDKMQTPYDTFEDKALIHVHGMARVVGKSESTSNGKTTCTVTLQFEDMCIEDESAENAEVDQQEPMSERRKRLYDNGGEY